MKPTSSVRVAWQRVMRAVRKHAGASPHTPVEIHKGKNWAPRMRGEGSFYVNRQGTVIHHPSAYRRKRGRPIYVASTRRVEVGSRWIALRLARIPAPESQWSQKVRARRCGLRDDTPVAIIHDREWELGLTP